MLKYTPGIRCNYGYKLNTNENQFYVNKNIYFLLNIISNNLNKLKYYPDYNNTLIINKISNIYKIKKNKIFISNGSDEILYLIFYLFKNFKIKITKLCYPFYNVYCKFHKIFFKKILYKKIINFKNILITIPNSPTGEIYKKKIILKKIFKKNFLIIDEAYSDFYNLGYKNYINNNNNLIIIKTLSKFYSLASIRIGILLSNKYIINKIKIIKQCFNSYNINFISNCIGVECISNKNYFFYINQINNFNKLLFDYIFNIKKTYGNFILVDKNIDFFFFYKKKNFFFRFFKKKIRITISKYYLLKKIIYLYLIWS